MGATFVAASCEDRCVDNRDCSGNNTCDNNNNCGLIENGGSCSRDNSCRSGHCEQGFAALHLVTGPVAPATSPVSWALAVRSPMVRPIPRGGARTKGDVVETGVVTAQVRAGGTANPRRAAPRVAWPGARPRFQPATARGTVARFRPAPASPTSVTRRAPVSSRVPATPNVRTAVSATTTTNARANSAMGPPVRTTTNATPAIASTAFVVTLTATASACDAISTGAGVNAARSQQVKNPTILPTVSNKTFRPADEQVCVPVTLITMAGVMPTLR